MANLWRRFFKFVRRTYCSRHCPFNSKRTKIRTNNVKNFSEQFFSTVDDRQSKYIKSNKGKKAIKKARDKYEEENKEKRRIQKREYMRRKRREDPNYCKWK